MARSKNMEKKKYKTEAHNMKPRSSETLKTPKTRGVTRPIKSRREKPTTLDLSFAVGNTVSRRRMSKEIT